MNSNRCGHYNKHLTVLYIMCVYIHCRYMQAVADFGGLSFYGPYVDATKTGCYVVLSKAIAEKQLSMKRTHYGTVSIYSITWLREARVRGQMSSLRLCQYNFARQKFEIHY